MRKNLRGVLTLGFLLAILTSSMTRAAANPQSSNPFNKSSENSLSFPIISEILSYPTSISILNPFFPTNADHRWVVRTYFSDRQMVIDLASWLEPWEVNYDMGYLIVAVTQSEYQLLEFMGFQVEIDYLLTAQINSPAEMLPEQTQGIPGFPCYRTVDETIAYAQSLVSSFPALATLIDIGDSWELTAGIPSGNDLNVLRLTNSSVAGPKPKTFIMGSIHAREYATAELVTRFAEHLLSNYGIEPDITWLLDYHEIHLLLIANPDGRKQAELNTYPENYWRKNTNQNYCSPTSSMRGADLNRNFDFEWGCCGGSSSNQCYETYRGPTAASEPETQSIQAYLRSEFPDQRGPLLTDPAPDTASGVFLDIHSYGQLVLWPWGFTATSPPNHTSLQTLGRKFSFFNFYTPQQAWALYPTDGTTDDFAYGDLGLAAYTFELGNNFFESCSEFENNILPNNLAALTYAVKVSRKPYRLPSGPDVYSLSVTPGNTLAGTDLLITATVDDTRYYSLSGSEPVQAIAAAEYYIDLPPWLTYPIPQAFAMTPVDNQFDQTLEIVQSAMDTSSLSPGRHIVYLRGMDSAGNWGPITATFIDINFPYYFPFIVK